MKLTEDDIVQFIENLYREIWMKDEAWRDYYNFILSRGLDIKEIRRSLKRQCGFSEEMEDILVRNHINEHISRLLR